MRECICIKRALLTKKESERKRERKKARKRERERGCRGDNSARRKKKPLCLSMNFSQNGKASYSYPLFTTSLKASQRNTIHEQLPPYFDSVDLNELFCASSPKQRVKPRVTLTKRAVASIITLHYLPTLAAVLPALQQWLMGGL